MKPRSTAKNETPAGKNPVGQKRGRKLGSKTKHTVEGGDAFENLLRAGWGEKWNESGGGLAHQAWIDRHPSPSSLQRRAAVRGMNPAALLAEIQRQPMNEAIVAEISAAIDRRDAAFFDDIARTLRRLKPNGEIEADDPQAAALLVYVEGECWGKPGRRFTNIELLERVDWGKRADGTPRRPTDATFRRLTTKLGIPMQRGPTSAK